MRQPINSESTYRRSIGRYLYGAWNGKQLTDALTPDDVLRLLSDQILSDDIERTLGRALHGGFENDDVTPTEGLDQLRERIQQEIQKHERTIQEHDLERIIDAVVADTARPGEASFPDAKQLLTSLSAHPTASQIASSTDPVARQELISILAKLGGRDTGESPLSPAVVRVAEDLRRLLSLIALDENIRQVRSVADVEAIDHDLIRALLGDETLERFLRLSNAIEKLQSSGYVQRSGRRMTLSPRAVRRIGDQLLQTVLEDIGSRRFGDHRSDRAPAGLERGDAIRTYEFGDHFDLEIYQTVRGAIQRHPGVPVKLRSGDLKIFEREASSRSATVIAIDLSRSIGERRYLLEAKRLALTLDSLIRRRFPRDTLQFIGFSDRVQIVDFNNLPLLTWDRFGLGTNIHDALRISRQLLDVHKDVQRNLILVTDGEPTAFRDRTGEIQFTEPPTSESLAATYAEAERLRRSQVRLVVALLTAQEEVTNFACEIVRRSGGTLIVTDPDRLTSDSIGIYGQLRARA